MAHLAHQLMERQFKLQENKTNVTTEILAGITTFATMAYVLAVVPKLMGEAGLPPGSILTAMVLLVFLTTVAMGLYTSRPFALAPGMGGVAIFSITLVQLQKVPVPVACGIIFLSGMLFLLVTLLGLRDLIVKVVPKGIKISISAGVGLFLCVLGLRNARIIAASTEKTALSFGNLAQPMVLLAVIGFALLLILQARKVRGAALITIILTTLIGIPMGVTRIPTTFWSLPASVAPVTFHFDLAGEYGMPWTNVETAVELLGVDRVDHGYTVLENPAYARSCAERGIVFTVVPTNSYYKRTLPAERWAAEHPIRFMHQLGLRIHPNSDDPTLHQVTPTQAWHMMMRDFGFGLDPLREFMLNGLDGAWMDASLRQRWRGEWSTAFDALRARLREPE